MIIDNENEKLSRNSKRKIQRRFLMDDNMKLFLNKIKSEKKKRYKTVDKIKELEIRLVNKQYANNPNKLHSASKELYKIQVINKNVHENKQEVLENYTGELEMVGTLKVCDQIRQTHIRFRKIAGNETYINAINQDYASEDAIFNGYIYKINTPHFIKVNRSQYGNGCSFDNKIIEYRGNICFIPRKGFCFIKGIKYLTGKDYKNQCLDFIRNEKKKIKKYDYGSQSTLFWKNRY